MATESDTRHVNRESFYRRERQSVPAARAFASAALADWGIGADRTYDVIVCVSELVTNALLHGVPPGRGYRLCLSHAGDVLRVEVHDSGGGWPRLAGEEADESGRGLLLVAALADKWGVEERDPGKVVWCEFGVVCSGALQESPPDTPKISACRGDFSATCGVSPTTPPPPGWLFPAAPGGSGRTWPGGRS